jgi:peptide/nickel transport system substrate-binding protein
VKNRLFLLIAALAIASMVLAACGPAATEAPAPTEAPAAAPTEAPAAAGPTEAPACAPKVPGWDPTTADLGTKGMTWAYEQEPDMLVGMFSQMSFAAWIWQTFGIGPGKWDSNNNLVAYAAAEIPSADNGGVSADGLTLTYHLKPCIFWSDGTPITSKDFVTTWKVDTDPGNAVLTRAGFEKVTAIDTPDDQTAVVHFSELYPAWPILFNLGGNNVQGGLLPAHLFDGKTGLEKDPQMHQPTWAGGPFAVKEWVAGDHLTLVRNPNYFGEPAKLDYINIKFVPDPESALAALKAGDVQFAPNFAESDIETLQGLASQGVLLRVDPTPEFEHLFFNLGTTTGVDGKGKSDLDGFCPFQDVNVRKAIMLGIDRLSFIKNYLHEDEKSFVASLWPNSYWYNTSLTPYPYDPEQAAKLLDDAGYKVGTDGIRAGTCNGKPVKFSLGIETTDAQRRVDNVLAIQSDLKKIGIDIKPNHIPSGTFFGSYSEGADMPTGKFDMAIYTTGFYPDPDAHDQFGCDYIPTKDNPSGQNNYHYCDPKFDALWAAGLATADPATRKVAYDEIQQYMYDNVIVVPLYARANVYGYSDKIVFPPSSGYAAGGGSQDSELFDLKP